MTKADDLRKLLEKRGYDDDTEVASFVEQGLDLKKDFSLSQLHTLYRQCLLEDEVGQLMKRTSFPNDPECLMEYVNTVMHKFLWDDRFCFNSRPESKDELAHPERDLFLWALFFHRPKLARLFWREGQNQLGGAVLASGLLTSLSSEAWDQDMPELSHDLKDHSDKWQQLSVDVMSKCHLLDPGKTRHLLHKPQYHWSSPLVADSVSVVEMSRSFRLEQVNAHGVCQSSVYALWMGRISTHTNPWLYVFCFFLPFLHLFPIIQYEEDETDHTGRADPLPKRTSSASSSSSGYDPRPVNPRTRSLGCLNNSQKLSCLSSLGYFYSAPVSKFLTNILSHAAFLGVFSYFIITELEEYAGLSSVSVTEWFVHAWILTMMMEDLRQLIVRRQRHKLYRLWRWFKDQWIFDLATYGFYLIAVPLRLLTVGEGFEYARAVFGVSFVMAFVSSMQFLYIFKRFGPKVVMIHKMIVDLLEYMLIFLIFMTAFGVVYQSLMYPNTQPSSNMTANILYFPFYQLHGEIHLDFFQSETSDIRVPTDINCEANQTLWEAGGRDPNTRCPEISPGLQPMLILYLVIMNLLLTNLLIAQFSYTFTQVQLNSILVWRFYRMSIVLEYCDRPLLPSPFSLLNLLYRFALYVMKSCSNGHVASLPYGDTRTEASKLEKDGTKQAFDSLPATNQSDQMNRMEQEILAIKRSLGQITSLLSQRPGH